ncbi:MAG TPA: prenyltransferase/squalene oxidase repeat-containing protein [Solirubrobacteraceae bacterium]|nr:prenyltransferase/squalene oxidase repeat-containing protein [Solirubrobacteraceae bacterium]
MSWQLAAFAIVLLTLGFAFWWYERSRPPAKMVALVAALAALAALGRDAFAAIPDVKPITAIVLVTGVAFGAAPGFATGALAALASNVLLGEGPWTPWQMLGWGAVGLLGAAFGALTARRPSPLAIALACAVAAEAFNLLLDLYTWTGTGAHTLAAFGVVLGGALAFDVTHVVASFAFGLAFGAVLLRMLLRVRARMHVAWSGPALGVLLVALGVLPALGAPGGRALAAGPAPAAGPALAAGPVLAASSSPSRRSRAVGYLQRAQNPDGGFGGAPGQSSSELYTAWAAIGLAAAGRQPSSLRRDGRSVLDALRAGAGTLQGPGDLERTILALRACGASTRSLAGGDPTARLLSSQGPDGSFEHLANLTGFAILAMRAAGLPASSRHVHAAAGWLAAQQDHDGGFGFGARSPAAAASDVDDTGATIQALAVAGVHGRPIARAKAYLLHAQNLDGGFPQRPGGTSNAQSTAWAVQGLDAASTDVERVRRGGSVSPLGYLDGLMSSDGLVRYSRTSSQTPVWVTAQALSALAGKPLPVAPPPAPARSVARRAQAHAGSARPSRPRRPPARRTARGSGSAEGARASTAARTLGALAALMLSPLERRGGASAGGAP